MGAVVTSILSSFMVDKLGAVGMFAFFTACSVIGFVYIKILVKDTLKGENGEMLSEKQKKEVYWPKEYKSKL